MPLNSIHEINETIIKDINRTKELINENTNKKIRGIEVIILFVKSFEIIHFQSFS